MELITVTNAVLAAVIIGLTQVLKKYVSARFVTLIPLVLSVAAILTFSGISKESAVTGLVMGLSLMGLYDQKKLVKG